MKTLKESICEAIKKNRLGTVELTVGQLVGRYYGKLNISKMTAKDFETTDFDPISLSNNFNDDYKKQFDFLVKHAGDTIQVRQDYDTENNESPYLLNFTVDGINFEVVSNSFFDRHLNFVKY